MALIEFDEPFDQWQRGRLRHQLADHPLMTTQSLAELALRLNPEFVRFHDGERNVGTPFDLQTDPADRSVVAERALEIFYYEGKQREVVYQADMQAKSQSIDLVPGDCVYMPMGTPHAVTTGKDITVTFSMLMNTRRSFDTVQAYQANHVLRRFGLSPKPVGENSVRDSLKGITLAAARRVRDACVRRERC